MARRNAKTKKAAIYAMSDEEQKAELTAIMTDDILRFVEIVIKKRVGLFVEEIYNGIKGKE